MANNSTFESLDGPYLHSRSLGRSDSGISFIKKHIHHPNDIYQRLHKKKKVQHMYFLDTRFVD